jgi:nitroimidazol reductase NimA-like FMN-containing flavoprotein (pyridoxamine 5'-phosphate oxidase superfamily)
MATAFHRRRMTGEQHLTSGQEGSAPCLAARSARPTGAELVELDRGTSLRLLATSAIGRVIFTDGALPAAQPVSYLLDHEEIIFRTANGSKLAAATRNAIVAFEVDEIDSVNRSGWSVLGVGHAYEGTDPQRLADLADSPPSVGAWSASAHHRRPPATTHRTAAVRARPAAGSRMAAVR